MKILSTLVLLLALTGCATNPVTNTQIVKVPIVTKCTPTTNITPIVENPTDKMTKEMSLYEKLQLTLSELSLYKGQNKELSAALFECTK